MKKLFIVFYLLHLVIFNAQTGIGTTSPINKLEVVTVKADPATSGSSANGNFRIGPTVGTHILDFGISNSSTYSWLQARDKSNYATNYILSLNPNGGNVGIGTTATLSALTVGNASGTIGGEITLNPAAAANEGGQVTIKKSLTGSTMDWTIDQYGTTSADARFRIFGGGAESNGITIKENGYVGIGTSTPSAKLSVNGDIGVSGNLTGGNTATSKISGFVSNTSSESASKTLTVNDNGMILRCNSALTLTLPAAGTLPEGFNCMVLQYGTGQVTFSGTYYNRNSFTKTAGQYSIATILYIGGIYIISGEMSN